ncbi:eukaryotic mitochondrial regulator protein-domain-containing protein [Chaetomidium leptoderma]|uniref:Eukaryotic mitochondrial regulator protein-domain-containing protein n=1 Tax=Chaetomidium leptoderma TaxID=669021 RepID=A0AAN6VCI8_9PEZI|nr:eukaryotic mitochondrial regulator protein-domain-containing protein [Chaetomidium leptoderma]
MPPRIRGGSCQPQLLLNFLEPLPSSSLSPSAALAIPLHRPTASSSSSSSSSSQCSRAFSTTPAPQASRLRRKFKEWCENNAPLFREPNEGGRTNYVSRILKTSDFNDVTPDQPFPNNPHFRSEKVLSERAREKIWETVMEKGMPLKAVSAQYHVDMRRVAAVVRMKQIEKRWERENKPMALPYARAIVDMLPRANLTIHEKPFESINDIHVHSYTTQQLFVPASESREFTRADAAKAFGDRILPPDAKMRIPELVEMEKEIAGGMDPHTARAGFVKRAAQSEHDFAAKQKARLQAAEARRTRVDTGRFEFRFEKFNAEDVGPTGRSRSAVGWRYGMPLMDRKRGAVKIPTSVE